MSVAEQCVRISAGYKGTSVVSWYCEYLVVACVGRDSFGVVSLGTGCVYWYFLIGLACDYWGWCYVVY